MVKRFQKVIDCLRGKGVDREAFMSCGKNDNGPVFGRQLREHLHSAAARHFHVEKDEIHWRLSKHGNCFGAAAAYADDLDRGLFAQQSAQSLAGKRFVIDDQDPVAHEVSRRPKSGTRFWAASGLPSAVVVCLISQDGVWERH